MTGTCRPIFLAGARRCCGTNEIVAQVAWQPSFCKDWNLCVIVVRNLYSGSPKIGLINFSLLVLSALWKDDISGLSVLSQVWKVVGLLFWQEAVHRKWESCKYYHLWIVTSEYERSLFRTFLVSLLVSRDEQGMVLASTLKVTFCY